MSTTKKDSQVNLFTKDFHDNWAWLNKICAKLDQDFIDAVNEKPEAQERPALDDFIYFRKVKL